MKNNVRIITNEDVWSCFEVTSIEELNMKNADVTSEHEL